MVDTETKMCTLEQQVRELLIMVGSLQQRIDDLEALFADAEEYEIVFPPEHYTPAESA